MFIWCSWHLCRSEVPSLRSRKSFCHMNLGSGLAPEFPFSAWILNHESTVTKENPIEGNTPGVWQVEALIDLFCRGKTDELQVWHEGKRWKETDEYRHSWRKALKRDRWDSLNMFEHVCSQELWPSDPRWRGWWQHPSCGARDRGWTSGLSSIPHLAVGWREASWSKSQRMVVLDPMQCQCNANATRLTRHFGLSRKFQFGTVTTFQDSPVGPCSSFQHCHESWGFRGSCCGSEQPALGDLDLGSRNRKGPYLILFTFLCILWSIFCIFLCGIGHLMSHSSFQHVSSLVIHLQSIAWHVTKTIRM